MRKLNRHQIRISLVNSIYQHILLNKDLQDTINDNFPKGLNNLEDDGFVYKVMRDLITNQEVYIEEISKYLIKWTFDRLSIYEQAILLEAVSEIKLEINSKAIVIDEAINLANEYCDEDSYKYINGVLDKI